MAKTTKVAKIERSWNKYLPLCLYGFAGSGKTAFCVKAAEYVGWPRTLWLHTERKANQFDMPVYSTESPFGKIDLQLETVDHVLAVLESAAKSAAAAVRPYDLVVVDSISELEFVNVLSIEGDRPASKQGRKADGRQVWGEEMDDMLRLMWTLNSLGGHLIVTAHVKEFPHPTMPKDENGNQVFILRPYMRGYWGMGLDHRFDITSYLERRPNGERRLYLKPTGSVHVKNIYEHINDIPYLQVPDLAEEECGFEQLLETCGIKEE